MIDVTKPAPPNSPAQRTIRAALAVAATFPEYKPGQPMSAQPQQVRAAFYSYIATDVAHAPMSDHA